MSTLPTRSITWDDISTNCKEVQTRQKFVTDTITVTDPLYKKLYEARDTYDNTRDLAIPVLYDTPDATFYQGADEVDNQQNNETTNATYRFARAAVKVEITDEDQDSNSGSAQIRNILNIRFDACKKGMTNTLMGALYNAGTYIKDGESKSTLFMGLKAIVADDPTVDPACGKVGNITRVGTGTLQTHWRNDSHNFNAALSTLTLGHLYDRYDAASSTGGASEEPNIIVMNAREYGKVWNLIEAKHSFTSTSSGYAGFVGPNKMVLNNAEIVKSPFCEAGRVYFLNTNYLALAVFSGKDMAFEDFWRVPTKQMLKRKYLHMVSALTCSAPNRQSVLYGITA